MYLVNILPSARFESVATEILDSRDSEINKNAGFVLAEAYMLPSREARKMSDKNEVDRCCNKCGQKE